MSKLGGLSHGVLSQITDFNLSSPLGAIARWVEVSTSMLPVHEGRCDVQDDTLATAHPWTFWDLAEDEHTTLLADIRVQEEGASKPARLRTVESHRWRAR